MIEIKKVTEENEEGVKFVFYKISRDCFTTNDPHEIWLSEEDLNELYDTLSTKIFIEKEAETNESKDKQIIRSIKETLAEDILAEPKDTDVFYYGMSLSEHLDEFSKKELLQIIRNDRHMFK